MTVTNAMNEIDKHFGLELFGAWVDDGDEVQINHSRINVLFAPQLD
jgi:hypothetical protein